MLVCEEVVEPVEVIVGVFVDKGDLETVGDADWVLEIEEDAETVEVILGVHDTMGLRVPEILVVDVFD